MSPLPPHRETASTLRLVRSRTVDLPGAAGLSLKGDVWGQPSAPLVVLLHGGGQTRHAWKGLGARLAADGYFVIAYDARGHGDSDWATDGDYELDALVADLQAVLDGTEHSGIPVLVGASMGGATALVGVGEQTLQAEALVLVDVAARVSEPGGLRVLDFMRRPDGFESLDEVVEAIRRYQPHRKRQADMRSIEKNVRLRNGRYYWHFDPNYASRVPDIPARIARLTGAAEGLDLPTLLVRGQLSDVVPKEAADHFLQVCPRSEYVEIGGAAHMVAGDRNDIFVSAVEDFLRRTVPQNAASNSWDDASSG